MNPITELCSQIGVDRLALAGRLGVHPSEMANILSDKPQGQAAIVYGILRELGVQMSVPADNGFAFWIEGKAIDSLATNAAFRQWAELMPWPSDRRALVTQMKGLRKDGLSLQQIADSLMSNWIPTVEGLNEWQKTTIQRMLAREPNDQDPPVFAGDIFKALFRPYAIRSIVTRVFDFGPGAVMEYDVAPVCSEDVVVIRSGFTMPDVVRRWAADSVTKLHWFPPGTWGLGEPENYHPDIIQ